MKNHVQKSRLFMIISMTVFGTVSLFVRHLPLSSGEIALYRSVIAAFPIGLFLLFTKRKLRFPMQKKQLLLLILSGISLGINWILLFESYRYTTVSTATLCYYCAPALVAVLSPILFRERVTKFQILCFFMSALGLVLMTGLGDWQTSGAGIAFGLAAAVFYAMTVLLNKSIRDVTGLARTFWQFVAAAAVLTPYVTLSGGFHLSSLRGSSWILMLTVGLVHTAFAYCLYFAAVEKLSGQQIAVLSYIDPLVAVMISFFLLSESMTVVQAVGGALILVFSLMNEYRAAKPDTQ